MKRQICFAFSAIAMLILAAPYAYADAFCDGWEAGYTAGFCYRKASCLPPLVPLCPLKKLGEETYQDGYNRGFLVGLHSH